MHVRVLLFAGVREVVGAESVAIEVADGIDTRAFLKAFCAKYPGVSPYESSIRVAVDGRYAAWDELVDEGAEVALIPPVAGG